MPPVVCTGTAKSELVVSLMTSSRLGPPRSIKKMLSDRYLYKVGVPDHLQTAYVWWAVRWFVTGQASRVTASGVGVGPAGSGLGGPRSPAGLLALAHRRFNVTASCPLPGLCVWPYTLALACLLLSQRATAVEVTTAIVRRRNLPDATTRTFPRRPCHTRQRAATRSICLHGSRAVRSPRVQRRSEKPLYNKPSPVASIHRSLTSQRLAEKRVTRSFLAGLAPASRIPEHNFPPQPSRRRSPSRRCSDAQLAGGLELPRGARGARRVPGRRRASGSCARRLGVDLQSAPLSWEGDRSGGSAGRGRAARAGSSSCAASTRPRSSRP